MRDGRCVVRLPDGRLAWFPTSDDGATRLARERRVLKLIERFCRFAAPRILYESPRGWDLRAPVAGPVEPFVVYERVRSDRALARRLGAGMAEVLAEQHGAIPQASLAGWLPATPDWPEGLDYLEARLPAVTDDQALIDRCFALTRAYFEAETAVADRVLVHADFGFHNLPSEPWHWSTNGN